MQLTFRQKIPPAALWIIYKRLPPQLYRGLCRR